MKKLMQVFLTLLILVFGTCAVIYVGYKVFLDKPGFFRQFDDHTEVRDYLLDQSKLHNDDKDSMIRYMHDLLSPGERCGPLRDAHADPWQCLDSGCPPTNTTTETAMRCVVHTNDIFVDYGIDLFFEGNKLEDIKVYLDSPMP